MIISVDHFVIPTTKAEASSLSARLQTAGFTHAAWGVPSNLGMQNELLAFSGGAFLELAWETTPGSATYPLFDESRVAGVGFLSTSLDVDAAPWSELETAWLWEREFRSVEGEHRPYRASGPLPLGPAYVFLMEGNQLPYAHLDAKPRLQTIRWHGADYGVWETRLSEWLQSVASSRTTRVGDVTLAFQRSAHEPIAIDLVFAVDEGEGKVALARGGIDLLRVP